MINYFDNFEFPNDYFAIKSQLTASYEPPIRSLNIFVEVQELVGRECEKENIGRQRCRS